MARRRRQSRRKQKSPLVTVVVIGIAALVLWGLNGVSAGGPLFFFAGLVAVVVYGSNTFGRIGTDRCGWQRTAIATILALFIVVAMAFDTTMADVFGVIKFTVLMIGTFLLAFLLIGDRLQHGHGFLWRNGLEWPVAALVGWTLVATLASPSVRMSMLGFYKSYDGWLTHVAFALLFFAFVHLVTINDLRPVFSILFIGAGGLVALYGLIQLHDRVFDTQKWDWGNWGEGSFADTIWSGLGNPNHLSAFIAILLPIGLVLLFSPYEKRFRPVYAGILVAMVLEIIQTRSRGAWLAVLISLGFLAVLLFRNARWLRAVALPAVGVMVVGVILAVSLGFSRDIVEPFTTMFDAEPGSTGAQRLELWGSALDMAADQPVLGVGPDIYRVAFFRYQTASFVEQFGPSEPANGPHNVFLNYLATEGIPGLLAFLAVLGFGSVRLLAAFKRLRVLESQASEAQLTAFRDTRLMLSGAAAGIVSYLVGTAFNIQQLPLTFAFWLLLGAVAVVALDLGVSTSLSPMKVLSVEADEETSGPVEVKKKKSKSVAGARQHLPTSPLRPRASSRQRRSKSSGTTAAVIGSALILGFLAVTATRPFRADRLYLDASRTANGAGDTNDDPQERSADYQESLSQYETVTSLNPWTRLYLANAGDTAFKYAKFLGENPSFAGGNETPEAMLQLARSYTEKALEVGGQDVFAQRLNGEIWLEIARMDDSDEAARERAIAAFTTALRWNPWDPETVQVLMQALIDQGDQERAQEVFEAAPEYVQEDPEVAALAEQLEN